MAQAIVRMPDELHKALKMESVRRGIPMQDLILAGIQHTLREAHRNVSTIESSEGLADPLQHLSREEEDVAKGVVAFMRSQKGALRAVGLNVIRAVVDAQHTRGAKTDRR